MGLRGPSRCQSPALHSPARVEARVPHSSLPPRRSWPTGASQGSGMNSTQIHKEPREASGAGTPSIGQWAGASVVLCSQTPGWAQASHGGCLVGRWVSGLRRAVGGPPAGQAGLRRQGLATPRCGPVLQAGAADGTCHPREPQFRLRAGQQSLAPFSWPGGSRDSHMDPTPRAPLIPQEKHDTGVADWSPSPSCPSSCDFVIFTHLNNSRVKFYPWTHKCLQGQCDREPPH